MEQWKDVKGYEGLYQVSNKGRVRSLDRHVSNGRGSLRFQRGRIMKQTLNVKTGCLFVQLCQSGLTKGMAVHRLVASAFIPNPENKPQVNHIDGNRQNNLLTNLEWATSQENNAHAWREGLISKNANGLNIPVRIDGSITLPSISEAARFIGVKPQSLRNWIERGTVSNHVTNHKIEIA